MKISLYNIQSEYLQIVEALIENGGEVTPEIESKVEQKTIEMMKAEFKQYKRSQIAEMREVKVAEQYFKDNFEEI